MGKSILGSSPTMKATDVGTSAPQNTSTGSGCRPGNSKTTTPTSAPTEPMTLGRAPSGALK